ncbi:MAG: hypothetical protein ACI8QD_002411 [Cyclobacteriaceae bacterium]|jgi:hypothetical protein
MIVFSVCYLFNKLGNLALTDLIRCQRTKIVIIFEATGAALDEYGTKMGEIGTYRGQFVEISFPNFYEIRAFQMCFEPIKTLRRMCLIRYGYE